MIHLKKLGEALGCEVVETSALHSQGTAQAAEKAVALARAACAGSRPTCSTEGEHALAHIEDLITHRDGETPVHHHHADGSVHTGGIVEAHLSRWYAVKLFERDERALAQLNLPAGIRAEIENVVSACEKEMDDDAESIITNQRLRICRPARILLRRQGPPERRA